MIKNEFIMIKTCMLVIMCLFLVCLIGCSDKNRIGTSTKTEDLISINLDELEISAPIMYSDLFDDIKFIELESTPNSLLGTISKVIYYNDTIYVMDKSVSKAVFLFNQDGKFINKIGNIGKGPGEYINISDFCLDKKDNRVMLINSSYKCIYSYFKDGTFEKEYSFSENLYGNSLVVSDDEIYINAVPNYNSEEGQYILQCINKNNLKSSKWLDNATHNKGSVLRDNFIISSFYDSQDGIRFFPKFSDTIFTIAEMKVYPFIAFSGNLLTNDDFESIMMNSKRDSGWNFMELKNTGKFCGVNHYLENDRLIFISLFYDRGPLCILYDKNANSFKAFGLRDDMLELYTTSRGFIGITNEYMIGLQNMKTIEDILKVCTEKNTVNASEYDKLLKMKDKDNNPILIFYHLKN